MSDRGLTHLDPQGRARMVDVTPKDVTHRRAIARGRVHMTPETAALVAQGAISKGDVLSVARVAGIQAAKRTGELIPIDARRVATFHASHKLKALIQGDAVDEGMFFNFLEVSIVFTFHLSVQYINPIQP